MSYNKKANSSNYRRIGDLIQLVDERNKDLKVTKLLGLSISKQFIPSVANTVGTDMSRYKIIRKNQFACSIMQVRRDKKMPVAILKDFEEAIISQAYPIFEVIDTTLVLPDYLMMWMTRSEFDRHACFLAVGGVRGSLEWEDFLNMELPIPSIEKQHTIVQEYQTITKRIQLNEQLNQKLEETAQAIYKHWFVDFEFPDKNGNPYKSSGGEMVYNEELEMYLPLGWIAHRLGNFMSIKHGFAFKGEFITSNINNNILLTPGNFKIGGGFKYTNFKYYNDSVPEDYIFNTGDIMVTMTDLSKATDTLGYSAYIPYVKDKIFLHNQRLGKIKISNQYNIKSYIYQLLQSPKYRRYIVGGATGTTVKHTSPTRILDFRIPFSANLNLYQKYEVLINSIQQKIDLSLKENQLLNITKAILLVSLTTNEKILEP
jgi:type I restriction enzyme S subunit